MSHDSICYERMQPLLIALVLQKWRRSWTVALESNSTALAAVPQQSVKEVLSPYYCKELGQSTVIQGLLARPQSPPCQQMGRMGKIVEGVGATGSAQVELQKPVFTKRGLKGA